MKFCRLVFFSFLLFAIFNSAKAQNDSSVKFIRLDSIRVSDTIPSSLFVAGITIYGNKKTKSFIIEREIPFKQGDTLSPQQLSKALITAKQQLVNTSLFLDVSVYIENRYDQLVFITVYVKERWYLFPLPYFKYIDPNFNSWWVTHNHSFKRVNYGVKFLHTNISGRNDKLNLWLITGYSRQVAFKYERPFFDKQLHNGYNLYFNYNNQRELNYRSDSSKQKFFRPQDLSFIRRSVRGEVNYTYRPGLRAKHTFRLGYINEKVEDTVLKLNPDYFSNGKTHVAYPLVGYRLQYSNTDYNFYPTKGFLADASILHRGLNSDMNLTQLLVVSSYTLPVLKKTQIQFKEGAILSLPFNQPFYNKTMFGYGYIYMRGYEYYVMDGVAGIIGKGTLQQEILRFKTTVARGTKRELTVPFRFYAKIYSDVGYAYDKNPTNSLLNNKLLHSWGFGIDMITVYDFVLKMDYSFNQLGGNGLFFHVATDF